MSTLSPHKAELISAHEAIDLRDRVLRGTRPVESNYYAEDELESTFHVGVRDSEGKVISNGTFMKQGHPKFADARLAYRLRGMATDPAHQKQGLGHLILERALDELREKNADLLWFNARTSAEGFYRKAGFAALDDVFDIELVGPHKVMYRWL